MELETKEGWTEGMRLFFGGSNHPFGAAGTRGEGNAVPRGQWLVQHKGDRQRLRALLGGCHGRSYGDTPNH